MDTEEYELETPFRMELDRIFMLSDAEIECMETD